MKILSLLLSILVTCALSAQIPDTVKSWKTENGVTYSEYVITPFDLIITLPGQVNPVNLGPHSGRKYADLGIIPGFQMWGFSADSTEYQYAWRIIATDYAAGIEVFVPRWNMKIRYGNVAMLYLMSEPDEYVRFSDTYTLNQIERAGRFLLKVFQAKFKGLSDLYTPILPVPIPNHKQ